MAKKPTRPLPAAARSRTPAKKPARTAAKKPLRRRRDAEAAKTPFTMTASPNFADWLAGQGISLAFSARQASKLFLLGLDADGAPALAERTIDGCGALAAHGQSLYAASRWQIWRFENALGPGERADGFDAVLVPKSSHVTGDIDCQDMTTDADGRLLFASARFNCLAYLSRDFSFHPVWRPDFISAYVPEDRCHLTGIAVRAGQPAYVTACGVNDTKDGWRADAETGGVVIDVRTKEVVCDGLARPHAPRLHGKALWLQEAGSGYLGRVDLKSKTFERIALCPGLLRGMTVVGNFAVACVSKTLDGAAAETFAVGQALAAQKTEPRCGLMVVDLTSGNILHWLTIDGMIGELSGVAALQGVLRPRAVGFKNDEIARTFSLPRGLD